MGRNKIDLGTRITYAELRKMAIEDKVADNKVSIGLWIKIKGYVKHHTLENGKSIYFYTKC